MRVEGILVRVIAFLALSLTPWLDCAAQASQEAEFRNWQEDGTSDAVMHLEQVLGSRRLIMLGELHGTAEAPILLTDLVAFLRERGRSVVVGLEIPQTEQALLDSTDREEMQTLAGESAFWRVVRDGRSSAALMEAITSIRAKGVRIVAFDVDHPAHLSRSERMAHFIRSMVEREDDHIVVTLGGNFHTAPPSVSRTNMVSQLEDMPAMIVNLTAPRGSHWGCIVGPDNAPSCGLHEFGRNANVDPGVARISVEDERAGSVFLSFSLPEYSGSPPLLVSLEQ